MGNFLKYFIYGGFVGVANIIPGLSGGTVAIILNIYDQLLGAIAGLRKKFKESMKILIPIVLGAGIAVVLSSKVIVYLLETYTMAVNFFFVGVIFGSVPMIYRRSKVGKVQWVHWIGFILSFGLMVLMAFLSKEDTSSVSTASANVSTMLQLFSVGVVAAIAMLIPGISGSFMMVLMGGYATIITAIKDLNIILLLPVALGAIIGLLLGSKLISILINHFPSITYLVALGLVLGSVPVLLQKVYIGGYFSGGMDLFISLLMLFIGLGITIVFDRVKKS